MVYTSSRFKEAHENEDVSALGRNVHFYTYIMQVDENGNVDKN